MIKCFAKQIRFRNPEKGFIRVHRFIERLKTVNIYQLIDFINEPMYLNEEVVMYGVFLPWANGRGCIDER